MRYFDTTYYFFLIFIFSMRGFYSWRLLLLVQALCLYNSPSQVFDQLQGWRCFCKSQDLQVSLYLCICVSSYVSHLYMWRFTLSAKGHQKSSSFWIFDQILLKEFLRQNVGHVVSRWIYRVARQCTMCHMPPIREGQLVVQHTWASILGILTAFPGALMPYLRLYPAISKKICHVDKEWWSLMVWR